ncbi:hypothetical protein Syn7502_01477 [Synechococcus sp. PCC 7502]|uniref:hypothetical protein n=1 Tax=Synechococcus sp. PCC 7502 TaxID=1173263 RepID=UPI00029F9E39|nr:hypothetical protein [Synechococcus sp. PCC 7502]AFY73545.1 hypothetical protein Syn7502_01477 [Synechococcus sp. PCC 7502]
MGIKRNDCLKGIHIPRQDDTTEKLADLATATRLTVDIDTLVRSLPNRSAWLRRVITEAAKRELINQEDTCNDL